MPTPQNAQPVLNEAAPGTGTPITKLLTTPGHDGVIKVAAQVVWCRSGTNQTKKAIKLAMTEQEKSAVATKVPAVEVGFGHGKAPVVEFKIGGQSELNNGLGGCGVGRSGISTGVSQWQGKPSCAI